MLQVLQAGVTVDDYIIQVAWYKVSKELPEVVVHQPVEYPKSSRYHHPLALSILNLEGSLVLVFLVDLHARPFRGSRQSSILGIGYLSSPLTQSLQEPSGLEANTTGAAYSQAG